MHSNRRHAQKMMITIPDLRWRIVHTCFWKIPLLDETPMRCGKVIKDMRSAAHIPTIENEDTYLRPGSGEKRSTTKQARVVNPPKTMGVVTSSRTEGFLLSPPGSAK